MRNDNLFPGNFPPQMTPPGNLPPDLTPPGNFPPGMGNLSGIPMPQIDNPATDAETDRLLIAANQAKSALSALSPEEKNSVLHSLADCLLEDAETILAANCLDVEAAEGDITPVMIDRLRLTQERIAAMADGIRAVAALPDPVGRILSSRTLPNGLTVEKTSVALGVIAIIYESRPNVTSDAASLTFKSGSVCVLRGGKESYRSNRAIVDSLHRGLQKHNLPEALISLVSSASRDSARRLMEAVGLVDLLIPRGGASLIRTCVERAKVPCIQTGTGICHIFVDATADVEKALSIIENAKTSRPSVCNAAEVCLVHKDIAPILLPRIWELLVVKRHKAGLTPVELRLDPRAGEIIRGIPADWFDFDTEFLDYILAIAVVDSTEDAVAHINRHSTGHSEAILTENQASMDYFTRNVDSAAVYVNASTRFTDGGEFGLGCEMGISTQKLHARGPMGLEELTSYKYIIRGSGQIR